MKTASTLRTIALAALTPLLEKNVTKTLALDVLTGEPSKYDDHRSD